MLCDDEELRHPRERRRLVLGRELEVAVLRLGVVPDCSTFLRISERKEIEISINNVIS